MAAKVAKSSGIIIYLGVIFVKIAFYGCHFIKSDKDE